MLTRLLFLALFTGQLSYSKKNDDVVKRDSIWGETDTDCTDTDDEDEPDCGYCVNMEGCEDEDISTTYALCYGYLGCMDTEITSDYVYADGYKSLYGATVSGAEAVYAYGYKGAREADSITTQYLIAYGIHGAAKTEVYANDEYLEAKFNGYRSGYYSDVVCNDGDDCDVDCGDSQGCEGLDLFCYSGSTCKFDCHEDPDYCPTIYCESGADCTCEDGDDSDCDDYDDSDTDTSTSSSDDTDDLKYQKVYTAADLDAVRAARAQWRADHMSAGIDLDKFPGKYSGKVSGQEIGDMQQIDQDLPDFIKADPLKQVPLIDDETAAHLEAKSVDIGTRTHKHHSSHGVWNKLNNSPIVFWCIVAALVVFTNSVTYFLCIWKARNGYQKIVNHA